MPTTVGISFFKSSPEEGLSYKVKKYPDHRMDHGYGLANIKIITEKYHGYMRSQYIEDSFETMIVIPILNRKRYF